MMAIVDNSKIDIIIPNQLKATRLALSRNNKSITIIKMIYNRSFIDGRVSSFRNKTYVSISGSEQAGEVSHCGTTKAPA
jgi:hypothetical protein